ncbi:efflux RND transporter periplasmic adaptor subunit [Parvibium lacunae]|uniref:Efflux RND transporter periplasmic adaptor subunit n=1 Tax=Parvibium lacunae TaxID=1888893 RepID=A0A368L9I6_9BURK|nr:efflux RND transporter periplasmic adaptor subunit [Parvibium lacunae]RCS59899.1 efflux RND transporter periplasmic adaptor subunit [Parvibium lacunae]
MSGIVVTHESQAQTPPARPALTVTVVQPRIQRIPFSLQANGSVAAWQEAIIGAEVNGLRLAEVLVNVGDTVRRGQVLATFAAETVEAEVAQAKANVAEADATWQEAQANAERARRIADSGALSTQQIAQYQTAAQTAQARLAAAQAQLQNQLLRQRHTRVLASDDGVISARSATAGAVIAPGQELFRLIRQQRLEWRAEVTASELARLKVGQRVKVQVGALSPLTGRVRMIAPTVDPQTRNALVYVDLPGAMSQGIKPGMFARGEFLLGDSDALTLPQSAVALRDGFSYVFKLQANNRVTLVKVQTGRRLVNEPGKETNKETDSAIEILQGVQPGDSIVASGAAFLADGDTVKVVAPPAAPSSSAR